MQFTKKNCLSMYCMRPTQYMLNILPAILFPASAYFRQQTHSLRIGMISHRSQVHQNVPSNRSFTSSFPLASALGMRSGLKRKGWRSTMSSSTKHACQDKCLGQHDVMLSGLARAGRWVFVSKWRLSITNSGLLWRLISWDRMHFRSRNFSE